jgi:hypothetical protein
MLLNDLERLRCRPASNKSLPSTTVPSNAKSSHAETSADSRADFSEMMQAKYSSAARRSAVVVAPKHFTITGMPPVLQVFVS